MTQKLVRVIYDSRDGRKDKWIPADKAHKLYKAGKLALDLTNTKQGEPVYLPKETQA